MMVTITTIDYHHCRHSQVADNDVVDLVVVKEVVLDTDVVVVTAVVAFVVLVKDVNVNQVDLVIISPFPDRKIKMSKQKPNDCP